jgi:hypothetical protein
MQSSIMPNKRWQRRTLPDRTPLRPRPRPQREHHNTRAGPAQATDEPQATNSPGGRAVRAGGPDDLTRRVIYDQFVSQFTNPLTGAAIPYKQHSKTTDILAVPGDLASATETTTGQNNYTVPHMGAVILNAGRTVFGADGTLEFSTGA